MTRDPELLFRRYQKTRDPELLARVFDATAPRLLRLAIHLAGDAAEAEDLVQASFVAAIQRADSFTAEGSVEGWLAGILGNKAKDARRRAGRDIDPERLIERSVTTPLEEAEQAELSGELARAIDALDDTYRQVLVLRLRHGMKTADIAHVLDLSPGAVRVRVSRGLEKLRQALPVGLASAAFLLVTPERGLAAVRAVVVSEAQAAALVAGTSTLTIGGLLMTKKVLLASVTLVVALAAASLYRTLAPTRGSNLSATAPDADLVRARPRLATPEPSASGQHLRVALDATPQPRAETLAGIVVDGATGEPLTGVLVELHAVEELLLSEFKEREFPYVVQSNRDGSIRSLASWPKLNGPPTESQRLDTEPLLVWTRPNAGSKPEESTVSDVAGRFELPLLPRGGIVVCELARYGRRSIPVIEAAEELRIAMRQPGRLAGVVIDPEGKRIEEEIELLFWGSMQEVRFDENDQWIEQTEEAWLVTTQPDGSFEVELPAEAVHPRIRTPGLLTRHVGFHPVHEQQWVFDQQFEPGGPNACACGEVHDVYIVAQRIPVLRVTDATTGNGIEHFSVIGRELSNGDAKWSGRYYAPNGLFPLAMEHNGSADLPAGTFEIVVWADGYAAAKRTFVDLRDEGVIELALEHGELPTLEGRAFQNGVPLAGATVSLQPYNRPQWRPVPRRLVALDQTDAEGGFVLRAPSGEYLFFIVDAPRVFAEPVTVPMDTPLMIDLSNLAEVVVEVRDTRGVLQVDHTVALRSDAGRSETKFTDEMGCVRFELVPAGSSDIHVPNVSTRGSWSGGTLKRLEVRENNTEFVAIEIPALDAPVNARVVTDIEQDLTQWKAKVAEGEWVELLPDGVIPIDLQRITWRSLTVAAPDERQWQLSVPDPVPADYEVQIVLGGPRYLGILRDLSTGKPIRNTRVSANPTGGEGARATISAVTDERGAFVLPCALELPHRLSFSRYRAENPYEGLSLILEEAPGIDATPIEVWLPRTEDGRPEGLGSKTLRGRVLEAGSGRPLKGARVWMYSVQPQAHGSLEIWSGGTMTTDAEGRYELSVPDVLSYRAHVIPPEDHRASLTEEWAGTPGADEERDFAIP